jgi:hypothetical protein
MPECQLEFSCGWRRGRYRDSWLPTDGGEAAGMIRASFIVRLGQIWRNFFLGPCVDMVAGELLQFSPAGGIGEIKNRSIIYEGKPLRIVYKNRGSGRWPCVVQESRCSVLAACPVPPGQCVQEEK